MLVEGIFIAVVVIVGIASFYIITTSQYAMIDTFNSITREERESGQEDVDLNIDEDYKVYIKNKSPTPVRIVEMRILDDVGNLVITCPVDVPFSGGEKEFIAGFNPNNNTITPNSAWSTRIHDCMSNFDGN